MQGVSQNSLADFVGLSRNNIASYESGVVEPKAVNFIKICEYFNVPPMDMLSRDFEESPLEPLDVDNNDANQVNSYLNDRIEDFVSQTNDMTKVYEGYSAFMNMKRSLGENIDNPGLQIIFEDLLQLLQTTIHNNWSLINSIEGVSHEEE